MKLHIVGSDGFIGQNLLPRLPEDAEVVRYTQAAGVGEKQLELTTPRAEDVSEIQPGDYVVFLAAIASPDVCRDRYEEAYAVNVTGTERFIRRCLDKKARVLFFSSDVVVGATETPQDETATVCPVGNYGRMKHQVEKAFVGEPRFKVFRLSYVFSKGDRFIRYLQSCVEKGETADVFQALYRNVIYLQDVLDGVLALGRSFDQWENQIFHLSGPELLCRADMAALYRRIAAPELRYTTSVPDASFFEARPNCIATASLYLERLLGRPAMALADAMKKEFC